MCILSICIDVHSNIGKNPVHSSKFKKYSMVGNDAETKEFITRSENSKTSIGKKTSGRSELSSVMHRRRNEGKLGEPR